MTRFVRSGEAVRLLGVRPATLYAYVSRGLVERRTAVDGRSSLYSLDDLEALAARGRRRTTAPRPSIDVQVSSAVTLVAEGRVEFRGHDLARLVDGHGFEDVAELLWSGELGEERTRWPRPAGADLVAAHRAADALGPSADPLARLASATLAIGALHPGATPQDAARRLLPVLARLGPTDRPPPDVDDPGVAAALASTWAVDVDTTDEVAEAIDTALTLLADHELATSTLAVRIAGSVRADPWAAFVAGLAALRGPLHGTAASEVVDLLDECDREPVADALSRRLAGGGRLPGFGHAVHRGDDPRVAPLLRAVRRLPGSAKGVVTLDELLRESGIRAVARPNVDLALGALIHVAGLPRDVPIFAIARLAGWAAHLDEELHERPLRFRGSARPPDAG